MPDNAELTPLMRQRRFLILMSLAVIAYYWLGLRIQPEGSFNGFLFTIEHADRVKWGLWVIWGWAAWRYCQRVYELWSQQVGKELNAAVFNERQRFLKVHAMREGEKQAAQGLSQKVRIENNVHGRRFTPSVAFEDRIVPARFVDIKSFSRVAQNKEHTGKYSFTAVFEVEVGSEFRTENHNVSFELPRLERIRIEAKALTLAILRKTAFSEYLAPLMITLAAVVSPVFASSATEIRQAPMLSSESAYYASGTDIYEIDSEENVVLRLKCARLQDSPEALEKLSSEADAPGEELSEAIEQTDETGKERTPEGAEAQ